MLQKKKEYTDPLGGAFNSDAFKESSDLSGMSATISPSKGGPTLKMVKNSSFTSWSTSLNLCRNSQK